MVLGKYIQLSDLARMDGKLLVGIFNGKLPRELALQNWMD